MKEKSKKHIGKKGKPRHGRPLVLLRAICMLLCVAFLAGLVCSSVLLLELGKRKERARAFAFGADSEKDKIRIYIDQGHNPAPHHNTGAEGNGLREQDLTFYIGCLLAELLKNDGRFDVCLSRPDESTVLGTDNASSLKARVEGASDFGADYFISLHINSYTQDTANGAEVFVPRNDSESYAFGRSLLQGEIDATGLSTRGVKRDSELYVLKNAAMPAVLVEMGFISNSEDASLLAEHPELFAQGIYDGILDYFEALSTINTSLLICAVSACALFAALSMLAFLLVGKRARARQI